MLTSPMRERDDDGNGLKGCGQEPGKQQAAEAADIRQALLQTAASGKVS